MWLKMLTEMVLEAEIQYGITPCGKECLHKWSLWLKLHTEMVPVAEIHYRISPYGSNSLQKQSM